MTNEILLAGFGGQGILFAGKFLAYMGLVEGKEVSWLPSYGPEMRGGTASCSVILSDQPVGSPIVATPDILVAMNLPSLDKFESTVKSGGTIFVDSSLIGRKVNRTDVKVVYVPSTVLAEENKMPTLANMIMMGSVVNFMGGDESCIESTLKKIISARRSDMLQINMTAIEIGKKYS